MLVDVFLWLESRYELRISYWSSNVCSSDLDFRPDFRLLRPLLDAFPSVPRLALKATADKHTREDILLQLGIPAEGLVLAGFDRPNIRYRVTPRVSPAKQIGRAHV